ncbi:hypothetical protein, partial [Neisseria gonorrhoeae]
QAPAVPSQQAECEMQVQGVPGALFWQIAALTASKVLSPNYQISGVAIGLRTNVEQHISAP